MDVLSNSVYYSSQVGVMGFGFSEIIRGSIEITKGNIRSGLQKTFTGLIGTHLGSRWMGFGDGLHQELMKYSLCVGTAAIGATGFCNFDSGIINRNKSKIIQGIAQIVIGISATAYLDALNSKVVLVAHQAILLTIASYWISKSGLSDLTQHQYKKGICKILLGLSGIGCAGYYVYSEFFFQNYPWIPLPPDETGFITNHTSEIEKMYTHQTPTGRWQHIGSGVSKASYKHPELPGYIVKIPTSSTPFRRQFSFCNDAEAHYNNLQDLRAGFSQTAYPHIILPNSHLVSTAHGPVGVEQMFDTVDYFSFPDSQQKQDAEKELNSFLGKYEVCDVTLSLNHNAAFIKGTEHDPKIGIYDVDCRFDDMRTGLSHSHAQFRARVLAVAGAVWATSVQMTRGLLGIKPARVVMTLGALGMGTGVYLRLAYPPKRPSELSDDEAAVLFLFGGMSAAFTKAMALAAIRGWKAIRQLSTLYSGKKHSRDK